MKTQLFQSILTMAKILLNEIYRIDCKNKITKMQLFHYCTNFKSKKRNL